MKRMARPVGWRKQAMPAMRHVELTEIEEAICAVALKVQGVREAHRLCTLEELSLMDSLDLEIAMLDAGTLAFRTRAAWNETLGHLAELAAGLSELSRAPESLAEARLLDAVSDVLERIRADADRRIVELAPKQAAVEGSFVAVLQRDAAASCLH